MTRCYRTILDELALTAYGDSLRDRATGIGWEVTHAVDLTPDEVRAATHAARPPPAYRRSGREPDKVRDMSERTHPDMWVDPADDPRETGNQPVGEKETAWDYLRHYRLTLQMKCEGLDAGQLARRSVPPSTLSLLGLVRHLAQMEHHWFVRVLQGTDVSRLYKTDADRDADFSGAVADPAVVEEAWATWRRVADEADEWLAGEVDMGAEVDLRGETTSVRDVLVHVVEEYARHTGHADLLRECIDGRTGQ